MNDKLITLFERHNPVIIAHRGTASGAVSENTAAAAHAAFLSGADIVEIDVIASADGEYFVFHTGTENRNLGSDVPLETLTAAQIDQLHYRPRGSRGRPQPIERVSDLLGRFRGMDRVFNVDRSWHLWPHLLDELAATGMGDQLLLKCPADAAEALTALSVHPTPFPFMLICSSMADVELGLSMPGLNLVGVELIANDESGPFVDPQQLRELHDRRLFTLANAEVLGDETDLFAGYDDEISLSAHPDLGWGRLCDLGVQAIQTDWPWLLHGYRAARAHQRAATI